MSWQLGSFLFLVLALCGGFAWYERSRPPAQVVALVAAMAALAIVGRFAFAAFPNVKPTTDIVLICGYAIGGAPGFAVGALTALVSNFIFGQGPWTPWQMAGWGLVGVFGGALAVVFGRRLGRWGLAAACGLAGILFGALQNFSLMVTYGGEQSLERFGALSAAAIPFDVAHAVANVVFALIAGPALVRMLTRFRERFEFRWRDVRPDPRSGTRAVAAAPLALIVLLAAAATVPESPGAAAGRGETPNASVAKRGPSAARAWLERAQNRDGGFGPDRGSSSNGLFTGWAALGLEAAGRNPRDVRRNGRTPIDFLRRGGGSLRRVGDLERTILVLEGAGLDSRRFRGRDLAAALRSRRSRNGSFQRQVNLTAFAVLALRASGAPADSLSRSAAWLRKAQNRNGGWGSTTGLPSEADSTGAAMQGLAAAGGSHKALRRGASYLRRAQLPNGGFTLSGGGANSQSTAWAVQGLLAAGVNPARVRTRGRSPLDYLATRQAGDGHYRYSASSDQTPVWVTAQALLAVRRKPFPLAAVPRARHGRRGSRGRAGGVESKRKRGRKADAAEAGEARRERLRGDSAAERKGRPASSPGKKKRSRSSKLIPIGGVACLASIGAGLWLLRRRRGYILLGR